LTASHAADAAPKAISMIEIPGAPLDCGPLSLPIYEQAPCQAKYPEISSKSGRLA
jgi:hypothetical protein